MKNRTLLSLIVVTTVLLTGAVSGQAPQGGRGGRGAAGQTVEKIRPLKPDLYMITGGGANTLVRVTPEGLIVVDTEHAGVERRVEDQAPVGWPEEPRARMAERRKSGRAFSG